MNLQTIKEARSDIEFFGKVNLDTFDLQELLADAEKTAELQETIDCLTSDLKDELDDTKTELNAIISNCKDAVELAVINELDDCFITAFTDKTNRIVQLVEKLLETRKVCIEKSDEILSELFSKGIY